MTSDINFSERFGYEENEDQTDIIIRQDAPDGLRRIISIIAADYNLTPKPLRELLCNILLVAPDPNNWSEYPNIKYEVDELLQNCKWYAVYDVIEEIYLDLGRRGHGDEHDFEKKLNKYFMRNGIGWKLIDGILVIRGPVYFEESIKSTINTLEYAEKNTAKNEMHKALSDLSKRPEPDLTGAVHHSMAALECIARNITGSETLTLGAILKSHPDLFPKPLDKAIEKLWGFASEYGRHLRENREPQYEDVELTVGLCASLTNYLVKKEISIT